MKLLLTNDDGIDAPGLSALAEAARSLGELVWVAPCSHVSGCGHRVTTSTPMRLTDRDGGRWMVDGTPADCVRVALAQVAPDFDWVLSGINHGGNLGADVYHSGTVAAAREAALFGRPAVAISQFRRRDGEIDWQRAARWTTQVVRELLTRPIVPGQFWNVNLPHGESEEPKVIFCPLEGGPLPLGYREQEGLLHYAGDYHKRQRRPGSDVDQCFAGNITVTELRVDV